MARQGPVQQDPKVDSKTDQLMHSFQSSYERVYEGATRIMVDCQRMREVLEGQRQTAMTINSDFEKLRVSCLASAEGKRPKFDVSNVSIQRQSGEDIAMEIALQFEFHERSVVTAVAFSPDSRRLAVGSSRTIRVYSLDNEQIIFEHCYASEDGGQNHVRSVAFDPEGKTIVCCTESGHLTTFTIQSAAMSGQALVTKGLTQVAVSSGGGMIAASCEDGMCLVYEFRDFSRCHKLHRSGIAAATCCAFSLDETYLGVGYIDGAISVYSLGKMAMTSDVPQAHAGGVQGLAFVPPGRQKGKLTVVSASLDKRIKIWDCEGGNIVERGVIVAHDEFVLSLAVHPLGDLILTGSKDLTAKITSLSKQRVAYLVKGHTNSVIAVAWAPDGAAFATGSGDRTVRVWHIR